MVSEETIKKDKTEGKIANKLSKRMVSVNFTGKELLNNEVFDTTKEGVAKEHDIYDPKRKFKALTIIIGEKELLPLVEKELESMKEGEERNFDLDEDGTLDLYVKIVLRNHMLSNQMRVYNLKMLFFQNV